MHRRAISLGLLLVGLASCTSMSGEQPPDSPVRSIEWEPHVPILQGWFGAQQFETLDRTGGAVREIEQDGRTRYPVVGGGGQWKLAGEHFDFGLEAMISFNWRSEATAFASGSGGTTIAVDVDLLVIELFGGPFFSVFLGEKLRLYVAAGPLMQFVDYDQIALPEGELGEAFDDSASGFGLGTYARTGFEFLITPRYWLGLGVRWTDSVVELDDGFGELDLEGFQLVLTVANF